MSHLMLLAVLFTMMSGMAMLACSGNDSVVPIGDTNVQRGFEVGDNSASSTVSVPYDSNRAMYNLFPWPLLASANVSATASRTLEEIVLEGDRSLVPVLVEVLKYVRSTAVREQVDTTLRALTKQSFVTPEWDEWMEWLGRNREGHEPPSEYVQWKIDLMARIDSRFAEFLLPALEYSRIDLTEVVWGGVRPDGIPDLNNPEMVTAVEAGYLSNDDRVFGVTINGESRAYPLRIVNAHEMVNDVVGGEPISLMW
jgi:hypothetical protein